MCDPPKRSTEETASWDIDTMRSALDMIEDDILNLAVHMAFMALSWDDVDFVKKRNSYQKDAPESIQAGT